MAARAINLGRSRQLSRRLPTAIRRRLRTALATQTPGQCRSQLAGTIRRSLLAAPGNKPIRSNQRGSVGTYFVVFRKQTLRIAHILSDAKGIERQAAEAAGSGSGGLGPLFAVRSSEECVVFYQVERRYAFTRSSQPQVRCPRTRHSARGAGVGMSALR